MRKGKRVGKGKKNRRKKEKRKKSGVADITSGRDGGYFWTGEAGPREVVGEKEGEGRERSRCKSTN